MRSTSIFKLGRDLNQRDTIAVKHTVSGLLKLLYPHEEYDKEAVRRCLEYALEARRRVKEQLKKIGGMEFYDVHFSYIDQETMEEKFISVPEQGGGSLDSRWAAEPRRHAHGRHGQRRASGPVPDRNPGDGGQRVAEDVGPGIEHGGEGGDQGRLRLLQGQRSPGQCLDQARRPRLPPARRRTSQHRADDGHDAWRPSWPFARRSWASRCNQQMVVLGSMSLGGNIVPVENLAESLQVAFDAGAKRLLLPMASVKDIPTIPGELFAKFQTGFYADPVDAVFKALGVE